MASLKFFGFVVAGIVALVGIAGVSILAYGRDAMWADLFGPPDLGFYDFDKPTRTGKLNDALACPAGSEPCAKASVDRSIPLFAVDGPRLFSEAASRIEAMNGTDVVEFDPDGMTMRAVVRTPLMRFPDTLSMRAREESPGRSALWLYSRSQIGYVDLGVNERRIRRLIRDLRRSLPVVPQED